MRHKDANLHLTKKCFLTAAQSTEQSKQADITEFVYREQQYIFKARRGSADAPHKDANLHLAKKCGAGFQKRRRILSQAIRRTYVCLSSTRMQTCKKCGAGFHKAAQYQPDVTVFVQLMRHKDANLRLTKKCGAGFQKAAQYQPYLSIKTSLHIFCSTGRC